MTASFTTRIASSAAAVATTIALLMGVAGLAHASTVTPMAMAAASAAQQHA